jgi:polyprenyldihydroxybenzoate methyltransferase/3-demethylubiquinol 3-O-methyltransferase
LTLSANNGSGLALGDRIGGGIQRSRREKAPSIGPMFPSCRRPIQSTVLSAALTRRVVASRSGIRGIASNVNTVDASEIEHFSKLSSQWWDERGEFAMLHKMNPVRMDFIKQKLQEIQLEEGIPPSPSSATPLEGLDILDVGCGGGLLSEV